MTTTRNQHSVLETGSKSTLSEPKQLTQCGKGNGIAGKTADPSISISTQTAPKAPTSRSHACVHCAKPLRHCLIRHSVHDKVCCPKCDHPTKEINPS